VLHSFKPQHSTFNNLLHLRGVHRKKLHLRLQWQQPIK
jgi:hypothetical protein